MSSSGGEMKRYFNFLLFLCSINTISFAHELVLDKGVRKNKRVLSCIKDSISSFSNGNNLKETLENYLDEKKMIFHVSPSVKSVQVKVTEQFVKIKLPHLYSRWCNKTDQRYLKRKVNKSLKQAIEKQVISGISDAVSSVNLGNPYDTFTCGVKSIVDITTKAFQTTNQKFYKLNEKTGQVFYKQNKLVKNKEVLKWILPYFQEVRNKGETSHLTKNGVTQDKIEKQKDCEKVENQCSCVINTITLAPKYSLGSDNLIKISYHKFVAIKYVTSTPFQGNPGDCSENQEGEDTNGDRLRPASENSGLEPGQDEPSGTSTPDSGGGDPNGDATRKPKPSQEEGEDEGEGEGQKQNKTTKSKEKPKNKGQKRKPLTPEQKQELKRLQRIVPLDASGFHPPGFPGMNAPTPQTQGEGQGHAQGHTQENTAPDHGHSSPQLEGHQQEGNHSGGVIEETGSGDHDDIDDLLNDEGHGHTGESHAEEEDELEERGLIDSNGNVYTSTKVVSPSGFVRELKEDEFVCYKPEYTQNLQISIFKFSQEKLNELGYDEFDGEVFPFFNFLCLKKDTEYDAEDYDAEVYDEAH